MESQRWLKDLPLFISIARAKSFARAADALGMSGSAVSRRMADFEKELGLRLLNRTTRRVELTEDGDQCSNKAAYGQCSLDCKASS
jgi:DNA-binding transcriptional LysR family regulator